MRPAPFTFLTRAEAFEANEQTAAFCGDGFVKTKHAVLVFGSIGKDGTQLDYHREVIWRPSPAELTLRGLSDDSVVSA